MGNYIIYFNKNNLQEKKPLIDLETSDSQPHLAPSQMIVLFGINKQHKKFETNHILLLLLLGTVSVIKSYQEPAGQAVTKIKCESHDHNFFFLGMSAEPLI